MPTGTDIVKISRISKLTEPEISKKVFSPDEAEYILSRFNRNQTAAGMFAAKEAFLKMLGMGITSLDLSEIEVLHSENGKPYYKLSGNALDIANSQALELPELSISHDGEYAAAVAFCASSRIAASYQNAVSVYDFCEDSCITPEKIHPLLPKRASVSHKGSYGRLFALAGSKGLTGAAVMACSSALKCGAGLITLGCAESLNTIFEIALKEVMTMPLNDENGIISAKAIPKIIKSINSSDVCLFGPGAGKSNGITKIAESITSIENAYVIADADALNAMADTPDILKNNKSKLILTPHIGEFSRLTGLSTEKILSDTKKYASDFAKKYNVTLVLKSHRTVVCSPDGRCLKNISGNPGMATGGTGDVLAGVIASFAAQGMNPFDAAITGVYIHSLAADMAAQEFGEYSLTPSDIISYLPYAIKFSSGR